MAYPGVGLADAIQPQKGLQPEPDGAGGPQVPAASQKPEAPIGLLSRLQQLPGVLRGGRSELIDLLASHQISWRAMLVTLRLAAHGLYVHRDVVEINVDGGDLLAILRSLQTLLMRRGYSWGRLRFHANKTTEDWLSTEEDQPIRNLRRADLDADEMSEVLLREYTSTKKQCLNLSYLCCS